MLLKLNNVKLKYQQDKTGKYFIMNMKVKTKRDFDSKVSNIICHNLNELCGHKWTKVELRNILNSADKYYLNEIGRKFMVDRSKVLYASAYYLLVMPKQFVTTSGEQLYVWLYRESTIEGFGSINIGVDEDFEYSVVRNYFTKTKTISPKNVDSIIQ